EYIDLLDNDTVITLEGLRQLVVQELSDLQGELRGSEFSVLNHFYENEKPIDEVPSTAIVAQQLNAKLKPKDSLVTLEHQMKDAKRSDFSVTKTFNGKRRLVVIEAKRQMHSDLFAAASSQLHGLYSINPDAEGQGIYLVYWYGEKYPVANR